LNRYVQQDDCFDVFSHDRVDPYSISNSGIFSVFETSNKKLWIGTGLGLDKTNLSFRFGLLRQGSSFESSLWGSVVECLEPDPFGTIWIGTKTGGLNRVHLKSGKVEHYSEYNTDFIKDNRIAALFWKKNELWIASWNRGLTIIDVSVLNGEPVRIKEHYSREKIGGQIFDIHQDEEVPDLFWLGTINGLELLDRRTGSFTRYDIPDSLNHELEHVRVIREFNGALWLATKENGVWRMDKDRKTFMEYSPRHKKSSPFYINGFFIKSLLIDEHLLWVGLLNGLTCINMKTGEVEDYPELDKLKAYSVMAIEKDDEGMLWLSTGRKGLVRLNKATMDFMEFGSQFGLNNYFMEDVSLEKDDVIYFGSAEGTVFFEPFDVQTDFYNDPMVISSISVMNESFNHLDDVDDFDKTIPYLDYIELSHDQNFITFEYALLNFNDGDANEYACMLEGVESRWNHVGEQTSVSYQNLAPGDYVFRVIGKGPRGIWSAEPASLKVMIRSPFWQTWWFRLSAFILVLFLLVYLYFRRAKRMERLQQRLEERVQERTAEVIEQKNILEDQRNKIEKQTKLLEAQNKDLTDSIEYATKIQSAILPTPDVVEDMLPESLILFKPKAILSGDFYYIERMTGPVFFNNEENNDVFFSVVDCTGHGVPGALMSVVGYMVMNQAIKEQHLIHTDEILNFLDIEVKRILRRSNTGSRDGMDLALCKLDQDNMTLEYSGAFNNLYIIRDNRLIIYKAERNSIGSYLNPGEVFFKRHAIELKKGDCIYIFSDGYPDQLGGISKTKKYSKRRFLNKLLEIHKMPMDRQHKVLDEELSDWMLGFEQMDDILIMGLRI
ncbi:MAG: SpoIIE family protein phosphatase, partial [bacterium]